MNALEIRNLTKSYPNFQLKNINLTVPSGCVMGLVGKNGAGKSTTIKLILGMIKRDSGTISIMEKDGVQNLTELKQDIGVVLDEIGLPAFATVKKINNIMKNVYTRWDEKKFFDFINKFSIPHDKEFEKLSRGTKMKMGIAIALSHDPKLLILDEATSGLDPVVRDEVIDLLNDFTRDENHSVLISSHIVSDLEKLCDYIAFIDNGEIILCEEKDAINEKYALLQCSEEQLRDIDEGAIIGKKVNSYNVEAVVKRSMIPHNMAASRIGIEDLFIYMAKEEK